MADPAAGAPTTVPNGTIGPGNATWFRFVGSTSQTSNRVINHTNYTAAIDASGTNGAVTLTLTGSITNSGGNTYGPVLQGTGLGVESGVISTGAESLAKIGAGTWTLNPSSAETYTKSTIIGGGNLVLDFSNLSPPTNLINQRLAPLPGLHRSWRFGLFGHHQRRGLDD